MCSRCCLERKTSDHVFFSCSYAVATWRATCIPITYLCNPTINIKDKQHYLLTITKETAIVTHTHYIPFWIMWRLWKSQNDMVFNCRLIDTTETLKRATEDTKECLEVHYKEQKYYTPTSSNAPLQHAEKGWKKPPTGWVKSNFDVSYHEGDMASGLGWIIRNSNGIFLNCGMGKYQGRYTIKEAECFVLLWAMQSTWRFGYQKVEFEGDNFNTMCY